MEGKSNLIKSVYFIGLISTGVLLGMVAFSLVDKYVLNPDEEIASGDTPTE